VDAIALDDGRLITLGESTRGGSKNDTRFGQVGHQHVVVKVERTHGRLENEERALWFLAAHRVCVPQVIGSGATREGRRFLVISREEGVCPVTPDGWARFGRDLAALLDVPIAHGPFPRVTSAELVADHYERLHLIRHLLTDDLAGEIADAISQTADSDRLMLTHGDPGSGNYLDRSTGDGVLLDWETALIAPFGLDLGRAAFIGLMDLWRTGVPEELVAAFVRGYTGRSDPAFRMTEKLLRAWITVGGLQFIHGRHVQPLVPGRTPQVAANVLAGYLTSVR
jgi:aminoglycoside phosphotransferase (APT) family kinase protein